MSDIETQNQQQAIAEENEQMAQRKAKLAKLRENGKAYPNHFHRDVLANQLHERYESFTEEQLESNPIEVKLAGRMMTRRIMGKASFAHIQDMSGRMQLYIARDNLPEGVYADFKTWDLGDIIAAKGYIFKTKTGELSVKVSELYLMTKALRPLPDKFHGLSDQEQRFRQRYVDLIVNEQPRKVFETRFKIVKALRNFFDQEGFLEVETPMMHSEPGGAAARPFKTHHNALDMELFLRVAPELYLKRLVVGGFEKVFEINRNFRNEGVSTRHNPEFTMIEFYQAYATYTDLMNLTEKLLHYLAKTVLGREQFEYQGTIIDVSKPFARMTLKESIMHYEPSITEDQLSDLEKAKQLAKTHGVEIQPHAGLGLVQADLFEKFVERNLLQPTFITAFPTEVSPLARKNDQDEFITDRFEFFAGGQEIANGFSELNDPEDQAQRFLKQLEARDAGDEEAMSYDHDYINALEYGMPPTAGEGIGIDRLVMMMTNCASIRDVILFPLLRRKSQS